MLLTVTKPNYFPNTTTYVKKVHGLLFSFYVKKSYTNKLSCSIVFDILVPLYLYIPNVGYSIATICIFK